MHPGKQLAELSSWDPQGSCYHSAGSEDMCHNLVKTCLSSRVIQEHVSSRRGSEHRMRMSPDFQMCNVRLAWHWLPLKKWKWPKCDTSLLVLPVELHQSPAPSTDFALMSILNSRPLILRYLVYVHLMTSGLLALQMISVLVKPIYHIKSHWRFGFKASIAAIGW